MKRILITGHLDPIALQTLTQEKDLQTDYKPDLPYDQILEIIDQYDCLITRSETDVDKQLIEKGKKLSVLARAAVGVGNIDTNYATEKGILVFNTPKENTNSAAELAVGLLLAAIRKIPFAHTHMQEDKWNRHEFTGIELRDKTVGIIGLGNVGHRVALFLASFNCKLLCYDPYVSETYCAQYKAKPVSLDELLTQSDVVTLHVPKNKETVNMLGASELAKMKKGSIVINTARGGVVNEEALYQALTTGHIAAAGIDTWETEPVQQLALKNLPNVVCTPHIGASTKEAQYRIAESVAKETIKALQGDIVTSAINLPNVETFDQSVAMQYSTLVQYLGHISSQILPSNFYVEEIKFLFRGKINKKDWQLIKLSFLKTLLQSTTVETVSFVNALKIAQTKGIEITEDEDISFSYYPSAIRIELLGQNTTFSIGGAVLGDSMLRLSYINGFQFEIEPKGHMLLCRNHDIPGVIGNIGNVLGANNINIKQFDLSRNEFGGEAMSIVLIDDEAPQEVIDKLVASKGMIKVTKLYIP